jgi:hypothetical protein
VAIALARYPGDDRYELLVRTPRWQARLAPPPSAPGVRYCPELHQELEHILGVGSVAVAALPREAASAPPSTSGARLPTRSVVD